MTKSDTITPSLHTPGNHHLQACPQAARGVTARSTAGACRERARDRQLWHCERIGNRLRRGIPGPAERRGPVHYRPGVCRCNGSGHHGAHRGSSAAPLETDPAAAGSGSLTEGGAGALAGRAPRRSRTRDPARPATRRHRPRLEPRTTRLDHRLATPLHPPARAARRRCQPGGDRARRHASRRRHRTLDRAGSPRLGPPPLRTTRTGKGSDAVTWGEAALAQYVRCQRKTVVGRQHIKELPDGDFGRLGVFLSNQIGRRYRLTDQQLAALSNLGYDWTA